MPQPLLNQFSIIKSKDFQFKSNEERALHTQINRDVLSMEEYAKPARLKAKKAIEAYMTLITSREVGRSSLFLPKLHAIVYARMATEAANLPKVEYKARNADSRFKMPFINAAKKNAETGDGNLRADSLHLWFQQNFDKILYGVGFRYLSYLLQTRYVRVKDERGKVVEKRMIVHDDIWDEVPDFFHTGVSRDAQPGMFGASSCYMDKFFTKDTFIEQFDTEFYSDVKVAATRADWMTSEDDNIQWDIPEGYVRVRYYWNLPKDLFYVQANGVPIRNDFIQDYGPSERPKKFLPLTSLHNDISFAIQEPRLPNILQGGRQYALASSLTTNKSFYTKSDFHLSEGLLRVSNAIWRAAVDHTKASSVHFLLAQSSGVYDQIRRSDLYGIIPLKNADGTSFDVKSLAAGSDYLNKFTGMEEGVDNILRYALGNDWRRSATELTNEKATVAAIRQQVQRVRMQQNQKFNESGGIKRHYRILLNLIQQYYPEKVLQDLGPDGVPEGTEEEDIVRDADGKPLQIKTPKMIPGFDEEVGVIFEKGKPRPIKMGSSRATDKTKFSKSFPAYKDFIVTEEEPEIYVEPGSTFAELKAIDRALMDEKMTRILQFLGVAYPNEKGMMEPIITKEGARYALEQFAKVWDDDPEKFLGKAGETNDDEKVQRELADLNEMPPEMAKMPELQPMGAQGAPQGGGWLPNLAARLTP